MFGDHIHMCAATHLFLCSAAIFTTVQSTLCFHKPSAPELAAFAFSISCFGGDISSSDGDGNVSGLDAKIIICSECCLLSYEF